MTCTVPRERVQPPGESPPWDLAAVGVKTPELVAWAETWDAGASASGAKAGKVCVTEAGIICVFSAGAATVSSSIGVSWEPPRTDEEFESGGTDTEMKLGAGLHSPEVLGGVLVCFFLRSVSIQLELCLEAKDARARDESLIFFPDVISSPKPSWCAKA